MAVAILSRVHYDYEFDSKLRILLMEIITDKDHWRNWVTKLEALVGEYDVDRSGLGFREDGFE